MTKTQPLLTVPESTVPVAPVVVVKTPEGQPAISFLDRASMLDVVPLPICWIIFGFSAVTLLIQIWNYFSS